MGYREVILGQDPISFWPLDDQVSTGIVKEASGVGNDGAYLGLIFDKAIPLVSNGIYGTRLLDSTAEIYYAHFVNIKTKNINYHIEIYMLVVSLVINH